MILLGNKSWALVNRNNLHSDVWVNNVHGNVWVNNLQLCVKITYMIIYEGIYLWLHGNVWGNILTTRWWFMREYTYNYRENYESVTYIV